jgi:hypothetical protein
MKSPSKKSPTKSNGKSGSIKALKPNPLHEKLIELLTRPNGATMHDLWNAGFEYPAIGALKIAERRGLKTTVKKVKGELTSYIAKR